MANLETHIPQRFSTTIILVGLGAADVQPCALEQWRQHQFDPPQA
jgi:hypothetical protein